MPVRADDRRWSPRCVPFDRRVVAISVRHRREMACAVVAEGSKDPTGKRVARSEVPSVSVELVDLVAAERGNQKIRREDAPRHGGLYAPDSVVLRRKVKASFRRECKPSSDS